MNRLLLDYGVENTCIFTKFGFRVRVRCRFRDFLHFIK